MKLLRVVLVGYGYWGRNLARNLAAHPRYELSYIVDPSPAAASKASKIFPLSRYASDINDVPLGEHDLAVIATPAMSHFSLTKWCMNQGLHVIVTKPFTHDLNEAIELSAVAHERKRVVLVDHTFVYTGAVQKMREVVQSGELGDLVYCSSLRVNLGTYRRDSNVIWDLIPHDLAILDAVGSPRPSTVAATAGGRMGGPIDQVGHVTLTYPDGFLCHLNVSWLAPVKMRVMLLSGTRKMLLYDDVEPSEKIKIYEKGVDVRHETSVNSVNPLGFNVEYRVGDMSAPRLDEGEALFNELTHFADCVDRQIPPLSGVDAALNSILILTAATTSAMNGGEPVDVDDLWRTALKSQAVRG